LLSARWLQAIHRINELVFPELYNREVNNNETKHIKDPIGDGSSNLRVAGRGLGSNLRAKQLLQIGQA
jgi:hypothetical protein